MDSGHIYGVVVGLVTATDDPLKQGRIKVNFPWLDEQHETDWIRIATPMAGNSRGMCFLPELQDEALLVFEQGDTKRPIVIGFLWNGKDAPPVVDVQERRIKSKNGHSIRFIDGTPSEGSKGALVIEDGHGNRITLSKGKITLKAPVIEIRATVITLSGRVVAPNGNPI